MDTSEVNELRYRMSKFNGGRRLENWKDVPLSLGQVGMHFALLGVGLGAAGIAYLGEKVCDLVNKLKYVGRL